ncbi:alpha/beta hydrolase family esterase [Aspergillus undulatus]|uniref:alpha/beta hydrolase family esterase n=1 Tax=Aspergillus undulatus TaxID=1810928 RepID=UPI003CCD6A31
MHDGLYLQDLFLVFVIATVASAAALHHVSDFGDNPGDNEMWIYVPNELPPDPPIIVADLGYLLIYPGTIHGFACWDLNTNESLTHNGGSDRLSTVNMVQYTLDTYNDDPNKVFAMGSSSGTLMALGLAATYPDVFSAVSAYNGIPFGCFRGQTGSSPFTASRACEWAEEVHKAWSHYDGEYPKVQVWHGTSDLVISFENLKEIEKQWSLLLGLSSLEAFRAEGVGHPVPTNVDESLTWFGLV